MLVGTNIAHGFQQPAITQARVVSVPTSAPTLPRSTIRSPPTRAE